MKNNDYQELLNKISQLEIALSEKDKTIKVYKDGYETLKNKTQNHITTTDLALQKQENTILRLTIQLQLKDREINSLINQGNDTIDSISEDIFVLDNINFTDNVIQRFDLLGVSNEQGNLLSELTFIKVDHTQDSIPESSSLLGDH